MGLRPEQGPPWIILRDFLLGSSVHVRLGPSEGLAVGEVLHAAS